MNWQALDPAILGPAFIAGLLVLATHVPLGRQVLARGIVFLDLAIAQIAGLGLIAAHTLGWELASWQMQFAALLSAALGALLLAWSDKRWPQLQEAIIGSLFVLASSGAILLLAADPHAGEALKELLAGQILWVDYQQLWPVALLYAALLLIWHRFGTTGPRPFYLLFAAAVTASVQLVGLYLVFASLILPALAVHGRQRRPAATAYLVGAFGYLLGLLSAALLDLPAGPAVVWTLALCAALARLLPREVAGAQKLARVEK